MMSTPNSDLREITAALRGLFLGGRGQEGMLRGAGVQGRKTAQSSPSEVRNQTIRLKLKNKKQQYTSII